MHPINAAIAPNKNIGLLPILPINNETGIRVIAIVRNCSDNGRVAIAAVRLPDNKVLHVANLYGWTGGSRRVKHRSEESGWTRFLSVRRQRSGGPWRVA